jgi:Cu+-exporting ATPase
VADVEVGTLIQVKPGEKVPIDGQVVKGSSRLDQSMLTGEAAPLKREVGDEVTPALYPRIACHANMVSFAIYPFLFY